MRVRIFIDFWNFQINWNHRMGDKSIDFRALPKAIIDEAASKLAEMGLEDPLVLEETLVYASVDPRFDAKTHNWLTNTVDRITSYRVKIRERKPRPKTVHCRTCGSVFDKCGNCQALYTPAAEKGVDAAIVTDMLSLAAQKSYDLAVLVSGDADFVPAVEYLQSIGLKVVNAGWSGDGYDIKKTSWAAIEFDNFAANIIR